MRRECIFIVWRLTLVFLLLYSASFHTGAEESGREYSKGCAHLQCESGSQCIKRRFWCKNPPCPGMLYCSKSRKESLKGPFTCDTVRCSSGHICVVRVRGCRWDEKCQQQIARCISEKEYHEGAASCAGFECPAGKRCILRESHCVSPPCKVVRSCADTKDVQIWLDKCRAMDCLSEYECFLRKPDNNCLDTSCAHTPDCTLTTEDELISKHCRGWICPRMQKCVVRIVGPCRGFDCAIERSCRPLTVSANLSTEHDTSASNKTEGCSTERTLAQIETGLTRQEMERREMNTPTRYPITRKKTTSPATSARKQTDYTTSHERHGTEISVIHQRATTVSNSIVEPPDAPSTRPHSMSHPRSWSNPDELLASSTNNGLKITDEGDIHATTPRFSDWSGTSSLPAIPFTERGFESTAARDTTTGLELLKKIYIASDDAVLSLPVVLEGINLVGQGYPIWGESELHRTAALAAENEDENGWRYYAPREPYRILLPPYEPVVLVEDTRRGQLPPFFTYALGHPINEAALLSLQEIPSRGTTGNKKMGSDSASVVDGISNDTDVSATVEMGNLRTNHFDDSPGDYANLRTMKADVVTPNIRGRQSDSYYDDYEWRPWYVIRDYLERSAPQPVHEKELTSAIDEFATDNSRRNETWGDVETLGGGRVAHEDRGRLSDRQFAHRHNKNLATPDPITVRVPTGRGDYSSEDDEERYGLVNYPYGIIAVDEADKSRQQQGSSRDQIVDISRDQESATFAFDGELDERRNGRPTSAFLYETSPYRTYGDNEQKNDEREYDEYYSHYGLRQH